MQAQSPTASQTGDSSWSTMFVLTSTLVGWLRNTEDNREEGGEGKQNLLSRTKSKFEAEVVVLRTVSTSV